MSRNITVDDIIDELRSLTDEFNEDQLQAERDILPELNRAQERAYQVLSRVYPEPLLTYVEVTGVTGYEYEFPEDIFMDKIKRVEFMLPNKSMISWCERVTIPILTKFFSMQSTQAPSCHVLFSRKMRFNAPADGNNIMRIWYLRGVDQLTESIGRITNITSNSFIMADVASTFDPTIAEGDLDQYFNVVDGQTGLVKASFQILSYASGNEIFIKSVPDRSIVLNRPISNSIATPITSIETGFSIGVDDYICPISGTCVLQFFDAAHTFIVQTATATLKRKLGYAYDADQTLGKDFEAELNKTYMGRQRVTRVKHGNSSWVQRSNRFFFRRV